MLEACVRLVCPLIMPVYGFYIIKRITSSNVKILNIKSILGIVLLYIMTLILYEAEYTGINTITIFALQIIVYKEIFDIKIEESLLACGMLMILTIFCDAISSLILRSMYTFEEIRTSWYLSFVGNILVAIFSTIIIRIKFVINLFKNFYENVSKRKSISNLLFTILLIVGLSSLVQNLSKINKLNNNYLINGIIMLVFFALTYLFIKSKNSYDRLNVEYENLFTYVQNFEDWIEKEQLNRHEYKNQLAVLRCLTSEKKVKDKIDEILEDSINIEGQVVHQLKMLPKGGIKGLMYYK